MDSSTLTDSGLFSALWNFGFPGLTFLLILGVAILLSCYVKLVTVLGILRAGLGFQSLPSAFVTGGFALVLTFFVMAPTLGVASKAYEQGLGGGLGGKSPTAADEKARILALNNAAEVWRKFLIVHTPEPEREKFVQIAEKVDAKNAAESQTAPSVSKDSWRIVAPAFLVSELKNAFATGLAIFLPFLVIDILVANILTALGVEQLSAAWVAFPIKLLLFVAADGWSLIIGNLLRTYA